MEADKTCLVFYMAENRTVRSNDPVEIEVQLLSRRVSVSSLVADMEAMEEEFADDPHFRWVPSKEKLIETILRGDLPK